MKPRGNKRKAWRNALAMGAAWAWAFPAPGADLAPAAVTLAAMDFPRGSLQQPAPGGRQLRQRGFLAGEWWFPTNGVYTVAAVARSAAEGDDYPVLGVLLDDQVVHHAPLLSSNWTPVVFTREIPAGRHEIALRYLNNATGSTNEVGVLIASLTLLAVDAPAPHRVGAPTAAVSAVPTVVPAAPAPEPAPTTAPPPRVSGPAQGRAAAVDDYEAPVGR